MQGDECHRDKVASSFTFVLRGQGSSLAVRDFVEQGIICEGCNARFLYGL